jgi:murein DD-endopeptidase MepM/ murein hydrolase activator NlpD
MRRVCARAAGVLAAGVLVPAGAPAGAFSAVTGGTAPPDPSATSPPASAPASTSATGGTASGTVVPPSAKPKPVPKKKKPKPKPRRPRDHRPVASEFGVTSSVAYAYGAPARFHFRIDRGTARIRVWVALLRRGSTKPTAELDLGGQPSGRSVAFDWRLGNVSEGSYIVQLRARDKRGRALRAPARTSVNAELAVHAARFPVAGPHSFGDADARYGAPRTGHTHAGQDIFAEGGTPIVAPRGGTIIDTGFGPSAGYYIALDGAGNNRDYFFAHLKAGSTLVRRGDRVRTGQRLGQVGDTGDAIGTHLHFEVWVGAWWDGGYTIDPLPNLLRWDSYS